jgi:hypothetical protein
MTTGLDSKPSLAQVSHMTPESPALPDLIAGIASHRLAAEAADDPSVPAGLVDLLSSGRDAAAAELGDRLLEGVRSWLVAAGALEPDDQDPYLDALAESLTLRDSLSPEIPIAPEDDEDAHNESGVALVGEDFELPGSFIVAATPEGSEADAWLIPLHEPTELVH